MSDIETMKHMIAGLNQRLTQLRTDEGVFFKVSGLNEEIEKSIQSKSSFEVLRDKAKRKRDKAKKLKSDAVAETIGKISDRINAVLPFGKADFSYDEGKIRIGWRINDITTPYNGLSGMQRQIFDAALANVLEADIIVIEAAEMDSNNLDKTLNELSKLDKQVIVNTCHPVKETPENFKIIEL